jgi:hypothetical protein
MFKHGDYDETGKQLQRAGLPLLVRVKICASPDFIGRFGDSVKILQQLGEAGIMRPPYKPFTLFVM